MKDCSKAMILWMKEGDTSNRQSMEKPLHSPRWRSEESAVLRHRTECLNKTLIATFFTWVLFAQLTRWIEWVNEEIEWQSCIIEAWIQTVGTLQGELEKSCVKARCFSNVLRKMRYQKGRKKQRGRNFAKYAIRLYGLLSERELGFSLVLVV